MSFFGELISTVFERRYQKTLTNEVDDRTTPDLCEALLSSQGEVSGVVLARKILERYESMSTAEKLSFFEYMTRELEFDIGAIRASVDAYQATPNETTYRQMTSASDPRRKQLARRLNQILGATGKLVAMRGDLLQELPTHPHLAPLDVDLENLFLSWFNRGFLVLRPISWQSPADTLEKIIAYEAVHTIDSWDDLRLRVEPSDRRCFGFFHPAMVDEPLIFVQVALTKGIPNSIQNLLADDRAPIDAAEADTAVFYSITNCQAGLRGISFGNSLIKQVVSDLSNELPELRTFVTLSPLPGLNRWREKIQNEALDSEPHEAVAAHYLLNAKRSDGMPYDPVARFHLGNGAMVHAVHADADVSVNGKQQSNGTMVNYLYDLSKISHNHEQFLSEKSVAASDTVKSLSASITTDS